MTLPASVPTVPEWQLCRVRWEISDYTGTPVSATVAFSSPVDRVAGSRKTLVRRFPTATIIDGVMRGVDGNPWVDLVASMDTNVTPNEWTITATATATTGEKVSATFTTPVGGDINLNSYLAFPVPETPGTLVTRGRGIAGDVTAVNTTATIPYTDGTTFTLPAGPKGDPGPVGQSGAGTVFDADAVPYLNATPPPPTGPGVQPASRRLVTEAAAGAFAPKESPQFTGGIGLGATPSARIPVNLSSVLRAGIAGTSDKVGAQISTTFLGDFSTDPGAVDPTFGFGLSVFSVTGPNAGDGKGGILNNVIEVDVQTPAGTTIAVARGLLVQAAFYGATAGATITTMESLRVAAPVRKNGATAGTATSVYGLYVEGVDPAATGGSATAFSLFVDGGVTRLQGRLDVANNIGSYTGTLAMYGTVNSGAYVKLDAANITMQTGTPGGVWNVFNSAGALLFQAAAAGVAFNGNNAIGKAAAIPAPATTGVVTPAAATYTVADQTALANAVLAEAAAINSIRAALTNIGITA